MIAITMSMVPFPPIYEQHQIVAEVERHLSIADEVEKTVDQSLKQADRLRQSILKNAFSGRLVPQDPNDEPASVLLERIRAEKLAAVKKSKWKTANIHLSLDMFNRFDNTDK